MPISINYNRKLEHNRSVKHNLYIQSISETLIT